MKARDVDMLDVRMMDRVANTISDNATSGRLAAIAGFIERHHAELAECEHGALAGRCEVDGCEPENFEAGDVINRAQDVADLSDGHGFTLLQAIDDLFFSAADFRELTRLAWTGARVSHTALRAAAASRAAEEQ